MPLSTTATLRPAPVTPIRCRRSARGGGSQRHEDGSVTRARQHALELGRNVAGPRGGKPEEERGSHRKAGENRLGHGITSAPARGVQPVCL